MEGRPPTKQQQSEELLPALDDEERKAVQTRARERLQAKATGFSDGLTPKSGSKTPKSGSSRVPGYMTPKSGGKSARKSGNQSSRSTMLTNRTSSPTGRYHPDPERRLELRKADLHANIDYLAPNGAPDNDRKAKESSWLVSQAFIEGLRYYPTGKAVLESNDSEATYSGNTHGKKAYNMEHIETDLRARLEIAPRFDNQEWRDDQLPREWVPDKSPSMKKHMARVRERLKR